MPSKPKSERPRYASETEYLPISDDGTDLTVEKVRSSHFEEHRFIVRFDPGNVSAKTRDFLNTLYRTFSDIAGQPTSSAQELVRGKSQTLSE